MQQDTSIKPDCLIPFFAPLSESMVWRAFSTQADVSLKTHPPIPENENVLSSWARLYQRFLPLRDEAYRLTDDALKRGAYSTRWIITELSKRYPEKSKPLSHETISRWREIGLLPYQKDDFPDPDRAIAMLILRSLTTVRANAWTPKPPKSGHFREEALWTCWSQETPTSPMRPCDVPLSSSLPRHTLLWTGYLGANLTSSLWLRIGELGCCRWACVREYHNTLIWDVTEEDLQVWNIETVPYSKELANDTPLTLHMLANLALLRLVTGRLETEQSKLPSSLGTGAYLVL